MGTKAITLNNSGNTLSTIASSSSSSGVGDITIANSAALTIGSVVVGSNTYHGLTSTGAINVQTSSGNLTITQNISTSSNSVNVASPALLLAAGTSGAIGSDTYNIILSGSPTFAIGAGGIADFYSGSIANSTALNTYILAQSANTITGGAGISTQPSSAGYNAIYRVSANILSLIHI